MSSSKTRQLARLTAWLLLGMAAPAVAQVPPPDPPPPPEPPVVFYGPTDVRTLTEQVTESRIQAGAARIVFEPATAVGEESSWLALGDPALSIPVPDRKARQSRVGAASRAVRTVAKDRSLILPPDGP